MKLVKPRLKAASCEWRYLAMLNYAVPPDRLTPFLPPGTELDLREGWAWMSLVGLVFKNTRFFGIPVPSQQSYEQIALRFYVRRRIGDTERVGVAFLKEIVPNPIQALLVRTFYDGNYSAHPTRRQIRLEGKAIRVRYGWQTTGGWNLFEAKTGGVPFRLPTEEERFFSHRLWSYTAQNEGTAGELHVHHPLWLVSPFVWTDVRLPDPRSFGEPFAALLAHPPQSAFLAEGSKVLIRSVELVEPLRLRA